MGKEADFMFTVPVVFPRWGLEEHEPIIIALFLPVLSCRNWRVTWTIIKSYWTYLTARDVEFECKQE